MKKIATIVSSNSHVEYLARVVDTLDSSEPPLPGDYGFGTFVAVETGNGEEEVAGAVYNSLLMNPEYANYGPRLSSKPELANFSPDFLDEQGCLLAIVILGALSPDDHENRGFPYPVIPASAGVRAMADSEFEEFHRGAGGSFSLGYYGHVIAHTGSFAVPLLEEIIDRLQRLDACGAEEKARLDVLRRSLAWQRTVGQARL